MNERISVDRNHGQAQLDRRSLLPILLIIFTNILGAGSIIPILPLYAEGQFAGSVLQITLLATAFFGAQGLAAPILGRISDRVGRRPILLISQMGTVISFVLFIFAEELGEQIAPLGALVGLTGGMTMLYIARTLDGLTGGNITTAQAWVTDKTEARHRTEALGLLQGAFGAGFVFGPAFGGFLAQFGPRWPFVGAALITSGTFILTLFTLEESLPREQRGMGDDPLGGGAVPRFRVSTPMLVILGIVFFATLAFAALPATFSLFADRVLFAGAPVAVAQRNIGLMLAVHGLAMVATQLFFLRPLIRRLGELRLLLVGQIALIAAQWSIAPQENPLLVTLLFTPYAFGQGVSVPTQQGLMTRLADRRLSGQALGLWQSARSGALIVGPIWAGYIFEHLGPRTVFTVGGGLVVVALLLVILLGRMPLPGGIEGPRIGDESHGELP